MPQPALPLYARLAVGAGTLLVLAAPRAAHAQFGSDPLGLSSARRDAAAARATAPAPEGAPIPALTGRWASLTRMPSDQRERWALQEDMEAGRVDPLAVVAHVARAAGAGPLPVPPGARYHAACSRALGPGSAVFTFGLEMSPAGRALLERRVATQHEKRTGLQEAEAMNAEQAALESGEQGAVVRRAEAFLRGRGYKLSNNSNDHQIQSNGWVRVTPAGRVPPDVTLMSMMSYPQCATLLPSGPAVHLSVGG